MEEYYVDLACLQINAKNEADACRIIQERINNKTIELEIVNVEKV